MKDEGYIKYSFDLQKQDSNISQPTFEEINFWRSKLYQKGWIGMYDDGVGYGNLSVREKCDQFYISGTATGGEEVLSKSQYVLVDRFSIEQNYICCKGQIAASSESLSHAAIYKVSNSIQCVIHIHNMELWKKYINVLPTSSADVAYGTPMMALELQKCVAQIDGNSGVIVMGGHEEGVIAFGQSFIKVYQLLEQL